jgi:hypothetical protein
MGTIAQQRAPGAGKADASTRALIDRVDELLELTYRSASLGNHNDPLDEAVYIILSACSGGLRARHRPGKPARRDGAHLISCAWRSPTRGAKDRSPEISPPATTAPLCQRPRLRELQPLPRSGTSRGQSAGSVAWLFRKQLGNALRSIRVVNPTGSKPPINVLLRRRNRRKRYLPESWLACDLSILAPFS